MTMALTASRPSLGMYGKSLAETTAVRDWALRRIDKTRIPASSLAGQTDVTDWADRRIWKRRIPASSLAAHQMMGLGGLGAHVGTKAQRTWGINPLGEHVGTKAQRTWGVNPLAAYPDRDASGNQFAETVYVRNTAARRVGKERYIDGFGALAAIDMNLDVRDAQTAMRKLGMCTDSRGRVMVVDNTLGPITRDCLTRLAASHGVNAGAFFAGLDGDHVIQVDSTLWHQVMQQAEGMVDHCPGATASHTTTTSSGSTTTESPVGPTGPSSDVPAPDAPVYEETPWYRRPAFWLLAAAAAGVGYVAYTSGGETPSPDDAVTVTF